MKFATVEYRGHPLPVISADEGWWCTVPEVFERLGLGAAPTLDAAIATLHRHTADIHDLMASAVPETIPESQLRFMTPLEANADHLVMAAGAQFTQAEIVIVIGKGGCDIIAGHAQDHIFGYTAIVNAASWSARRAPMPCLEVEDCSSGIPLARWIVGAAEVADPRRLRVHQLMNTEQQYQTDAALQHTCINASDIVSAASRFRALRPGDLVATGHSLGAGFGSLHHTTPASSINTVSASRPCHIGQATR